MLGAGAGARLTCTNGIPPRCLEYALGSAGTWLPYIIGGLSVGEVQAWDALTPSSGQAFRGGWTVGAGVETLRTPNWSIFIWILGPRNYLMSSPVLPKRSVSKPIWLVLA